MSDSINPLSSIASMSGVWPQSALSAAGSETDQSFQQVLSTLLTASGMSSMTSMMGDMSGQDLSGNLMPMMMMLLEQLLAEQLQSTPAASEASIPSGQPVNGPVTQNSHTGHVALDFGIPVGTPVRSTMEGQVVYAGWNNEGYGNLVILENGPYRTYYAHLSELPVAVGQQVAAGSVIGLSGNTGNSTGPHLHYEIRLNQTQINPEEMTLPKY